MSTQVIHASIEMFHRFHMSNLVLHPQLNKKKIEKLHPVKIAGSLVRCHCGRVVAAAVARGGGEVGSVGRTAAATLSPRPDRSALILPVLAKMSNT